MKHTKKLITNHQALNSYVSQPNNATTRHHPTKRQHCRKHPN